MTMKAEKRLDPASIETVRQNADCLYTEAQVETALDSMAAEISNELGDANPLVICVMNGGLVPMGKLITRLDFKLQIDYLHATRYRNDTRGYDLEWRAEPQHSLQDRVVLVVDDILDEGLTLEAIVRYCENKQARKVYTAVLVDKKHDRKHGIECCDFTGLEVEDRYVFGYGMDYKGFLRNAPGIFAVKE